MLTISKLARRCGLSRSTLLYYESIGLLGPAARTPANYRRYGTADLRRLEQICVYRDAGLKLELIELNGEIERLRGHQRAILKLLRSSRVGRMKVVTKEKWVSVMKAAGFTEADMHRWHAEFERSAPEEHQEFLEFLHIPGEEIRTIRDWSQKAVTP
jgi:DNA-binding transcriptional MerR regulator